MPRNSKQSNRQLEKILQMAAKLNSEELDLLHQSIEALMRDGSPEIGDDKNDGKGHVVHKMINGCGPYRYLRYRQDGKYKSVYLGK